MTGAPIYTVEFAVQTARTFVGPLKHRWPRAAVVAVRATELLPAVDTQDRDTLMMAAWLHDIGYAPAITRTGFPPLDGARYLRKTRWPDPVVNLVAHHSGARFEAEQRGLSAELAEFPFQDNELDDALTTADLTTGADGYPVLYAERLAEILSHCPVDDPVHRAWQHAGPIVAEAIARTRARMAATVWDWTSDVIDRRHSVTQPSLISEDVE